MRVHHVRLDLRESVRRGRGRSHGRRRAWDNRVFNVNGHQSLGGPAEEAAVVQAAEDVSLES